jgi:hypothetical protein
MKTFWDKLMKVMPIIWGILLVSIITASGGVVLVLLIKLLIMLVGGM